MKAGYQIKLRFSQQQQGSSGNTTFKRIIKNAMKIK